MLKKTYGSTGKEVSVIGMGGMRFDDPDDIDGMAEIVLHAHSRGINYFDTAPKYCGDKSEPIFGRALRQLPRDSYYVSTKCSSPNGDELLRSLEQSLDRLGVDQIDFFHIWCIITLEAWKERLAGGAVAAAIKAREQGMIGHLVVSSHLPGKQLHVLLDDAPFEGVTLGYCVINFPYRQAALDLAGQRNIGVVTMNPLGGGTIPNNPERFDFLRAPDDPSALAAALRFNISQPSVTSALVGFSCIEHVDQAADAVENFTPYDQAHIDAVQKKIHESFNDLCTGCGYCLPCPAGIEIRNMMDAYNQLLLGGQDIAQRLMWHWNLTPDHANKCIRCGRCEARCTQHLPIMKRLQYIASLAEEKLA